MIASFGIPAEYRDFQTRNPIAPDRGTLAGRTVLERRAVHIEDAAADPEYTRIEAVRLETTTVSTCEKEEKNSVLRSLPTSVQKSIKEIREQCIAQLGDVHED